MYILDVNGRKKRALGIVKDIQITVQQKCKTKLKMQVTDSNTYQVILGNDWLIKVYGIINIPAEEIVLGDEELGITIKQPISLYNYHHREEIDEEEVQEIYYKYDHPGIMEDMIDGEDLDHIEGKYFWDDQTLVERFKGKTTEEQEKEMWEQWPHLSKEQRHQLGNLLDVYKNGFAETMEELGQTDVYRHQIPTGDNFTKAQKLRRYSPAQQEFIQEEVERMLKAGIVRPAKESSWATNVVVVEKKNGKMRLCVDYRDLNKITKKDKYPLPNIQETLDSFHGAKWFTTLDLACGYWQLLMAAGDIEKTSFITNRGHYQFVRMPFGLTNAPAAFQRLMDKVLKAEMGRFVQVYLDDIVIYSKTWEEHLQHIECVIKRLEKAGLKMGRPKCFFAQKEIEFLGHIVSEKGIGTSPRLVEKIKNWPTPESKTDARRFIGLVGYYRNFIQDFSKIAKPIFKVTSNDEKVEFYWSSEQQKAMDQLKELIIEDVVLKHPKFEKEFILYVDASGGGLGAVLSPTLQWLQIIRP